MTEQLQTTGVAAKQDVDTKLPPKERDAKGPYAVIECYQEIPCDPCTKACLRGAILPMADINDIPVIDFDKCNGCALCVSQCPGLAIFVVDLSLPGNEATVRIPYESLPLPTKGMRVKALDRSGEELCDAEVFEVRASGSLGKTNIVGIRVPKRFAHEARNIRMEKSNG